MGRLRSLLKAVHDRAFKNHVYEVRYGYMRGYKRRGRMPWLQRDLRDQKHHREERFFLSLELDGKVAYDIGANLGTHTIMLRRLVGAGGAVHAFEPDPTFCDQLADTIRLNDLTSNVFVHPVGLGDEPGRLRLVIPHSHRVMMSATLSKALQDKLTPADTMRSSEVDVVRLDDWCTKHSLPPPDFMKIDVEGFEANVLEGAMETITAAKPMLFIEIHGASRDDQRVNMKTVLGRLAPVGYRFEHLESGQQLAMDQAELPAGGHVIARVASR